MIFDGSEGCDDCSFMAKACCLSLSASSAAICSGVFSFDPCVASMTLDTPLAVDISPPSTFFLAAVALGLRARGFGFSFSFSFSASLDTIESTATRVERLVALRTSGSFFCGSSSFSLPESSRIISGGSLCLFSSFLFSSSC